MTYRPYTEAEIEQGLQALAISSGNAARAVELLDDPPDQRTLHSWKRKHHDRYAELQAQVREHVVRDMAESSDDLARRFARLEAAAADRLEEELSELDPRDLAATIRSLSVSRGISVQKGQELRGEPTAVVEHRKSPEELVAQLRRLGIVREEAGRPAATVEENAKPALPAG